MSAQAQTRLETLAEATESLFTALFNSRKQEGQGAVSILRFEEVKAAREDYKDALAAFLMPVVRVVDGGLAGQQPTDKADEMVCRKCGKTERCELACPEWHATIRNEVDTAPETFEICPVCDCPSDPSILCCEKNCPRRADNGLA